MKGEKTGWEYAINRTDIYTLELRLMSKRIPTQRSKVLKTGRLGQDSETGSKSAPGGVGVRTRGNDQTLEPWLARLTGSCGNALQSS